MSSPRKIGASWPESTRPWLSRLHMWLKTARRRGLHPPEDIDRLARRVQVPTLPVSDEELARTGHYDRGQRLVRQDAWEDLSEAIRSADRARRTTPGGEPAALLLARGARGDVVGAVEDALHDLSTPDPDGLRDFASILQDHPRDYASAMVVARAHLDVAAAWYRAAELRDPHETAAHMSYHLSEAKGILAPFRAAARGTPSLCAAFAVLAAMTNGPVSKLVEHYECLISLEPGTHRHMRNFGRHLLPLPDGGPAAIEVAARRMAVQTEAHWGTGGYVWTYLDVLALDASTLDLIDPDFFVAGLRDILDRTSDQHVANLLAAFCAITMRSRPDTPTPPHAAKARKHIHEFVDHILHHHLSELHPMIWSQALLAPGARRSLPARRALISKGRQTALRVIAARLAADIATHGTIALTDAGMQPVPTER